MHVDVLPRSMDIVLGVLSGCIFSLWEGGFPLFVVFLFLMLTQMLLV